MSELVNGWYITREEAEPIVDQLIAFYDQLAFNAMNKILKDLRKESYKMAKKPISSTQVAKESLGN